MSILIRSLTIDCADPYESALFWSKVTGRPLGDDDNPGDPEAVVVLPEGNQPAALLFIRVPEGKRDEPTSGHAAHRSRCALLRSGEV
jgi:hypothetical protein